MRSQPLVWVLAGLCVWGGPVHAQQGELERLTAPDGRAGDELGTAVALTSTIAAIGAPMSETGGVASGAVYLYRWVAGRWEPLDPLVPSDPNPGQQFGASISLSPDFLLVGAPGDGTLGDVAGAVYVFRHVGDAFVEELKILAGDGSAGDRFGISVDLGIARAVVGADRHDEIAGNAGAVYVFERTGVGTWGEEAKMLAFDGGVEDRFGRAVALDGNTLLVGAWLNSSTAPSAGAAYGYRFDGGLWTFEGKVFPSDGQSGDGFGYSVALDGDCAVIGAPLRASGGTATGTAFVFRHVGTSWFEEQEIHAAESSTSDRFGVSTAIQGETIVAGAWLADRGQPDTGAAHVFRYESHGGAACGPATQCWGEVTILEATDRAIGDHLGVSVALATEVILVGAPQHDALGEDSGAAYLFERPGLDRFVRGDCNTDGDYDVADAVFLLQALFISEVPSCHDACDGNDDGALDVSDAIYVFSNLFAFGPPPPAPHDACELDPTGDSLGCETFGC